MIVIKERKPLGHKGYGTIPHLEGSRTTMTDKHCHEGQTRIATQKKRDFHDEIIVQEKLDGSNVCVALLNGEIIALTRAGYRAETSPFEQHWHWEKWVEQNESRFRYVLEEGERLVGEWLMQAHGTRYELPHEPFVTFDLMKGHERLVYDVFLSRIKRGHFASPHLIGRGYPMSVESAMKYLGEHGFHGAIDKAEGCVWRVQRKGKVDFLCKYVRPDKQDGIYLPEITGKEPVWNWQPR